MSADRARTVLGAIPGAAVEAGGAPVVVRVPVQQWEAAARLAKDTLGCAFFSFLTAIDWKAEGIEIVAWVDNLQEQVSIELRTRLPQDAPACASLTAVYRGADW